MKTRARLKTLPVVAALLIVASVGHGRISFAADVSIVPEIRAQVVAVKSAVISAQIAGQISELPVVEGDRVKEGDLLVGIDCALNKARFDKARAQRDAAQKTADVNSRLDKLGAISKLENDVAREQMAAADAEANLTSLMLERCRIKAPFGGRIGDVKARRFQYVQEGQELVELIDDRDLELQMNVPSAWLKSLVVGLPFQVSIDELGRRVQARLVRISPKIDPVSQSVKIFASIQGTTDDVLPGMSGHAEFADLRAKPQ